MNLVNIIYNPDKSRFLPEVMKLRINERRIIELFPGDNWMSIELLTELEALGEFNQNVGKYYEIKPAQSTSIKPINTEQKTLPESKEVLSKKDKEEL